MVYSTQNLWGFGLFPRPVFLGVEIRRFGNWICFKHQLKWGEDAYSFGSF
jgi:hypothetical protein